MYFNNVIKKVKNKKNKWITIVVIFSILMVVFSGISFGKTLHNSIIKNNAQIAKPILEVEKNSEIIINENNKTGEYNFKVKNYNESEEISQVNLKYYIEILDNNIDESVKYELYKEEKKIDLNENKTNEFILKQGEKNEQEYKLKIEYNSDKNNIGDIVKEIQIKVHSEQLKI